MESLPLRVREKYVPYEVGRYIHLPGHNPIEFFIELTPETLLACGILKKIADVFASRKISILHFKMSRPVIGKPLYLLFFADIKDKRIIEEIKVELENISGVKRVEIVSPLFEGLTVDKFFFPLMIENERVIIFRKTIYEALIKKVREECGSSYEAILFYIGVNIGREAYKDHVRIAGSEDIDRLLKINEELFRLVGFGILRYIHFELDKGCRVRVYNSFECELFKGCGRPSSHLVRGMMVGWFMEASKIKDLSHVRVFETKCIAKGDPYCEIVITVLP